MNIQLLFFASIREALQTDKEFVNLPKEVQTVGDVRTFLVKRGDKWAEVLGQDKILHMAYDHKITTPDRRIEAGGVIAFFPPVTGG